MNSTLSEDEYRQIVIEWNATARDYPYEQCLHQLIEAQVKQTPDVPAIIFEGALLTYRQLNERANQLARYLQSLGVGPEVIVGVSMERSLELVIALVGILKAGGAYVPLDPELPADRLAFMLEDLRVGMDGQSVIVLTQSSLAARFPEHNARLVCLDSVWEHILLEAGENLPCIATPDGLAYVIYTSGSTGKPKGALNTHRGICNRLLWMQDAYRLTSADCVMQKTPFSFDVSVWEFFWPLITGSRLVVARPGGHKDSAYLLALIQEQQVTTLHFVPSMLQIFLEEPALEACTSLRQVICSGEALPYPLQERFFARHPAALHNLYGPTEAAIDVTSWACQRGGPQGIVPIGRPIANTRIYILDSDGQPVPVNAQGELYIGGVGVARGYLNRPELTAERFLHDPFTDQPDARLYRTGDLARYLPDGTIVYLGRVDHQVKLRGFRIELGEIEAVLGQHPAVRETAVIVHTDTTGDKRLVAYVVVHKGQHLSVQDMRQYMARQVPDYMIPATLVVLEAFPLNTSGKVDRGALPVPGRERPELAIPYVAPSLPAEEQIAGIWSKVLGIEQIGVEDDFFTLGGHSLLAMQIASHLREALQVEVTLRAIFDAPTIRQLAALMTNLAGNSLAESSLPGIAGTARQPWVSSPSVHKNTGEVVVAPASFAQQNLWLLDQMTPGNAAYNIPATVRIHAPLDPQILRRSVQEMVLRHETLRTTFAMLDGQLMQVIARNKTLQLIEKDLQDIPAPEREAMAQCYLGEEAARPFDLACGPLIRLTLLHLGEQEHLLVLVMHHSISDGWSVSVFFQELSALYTAFVAGRPSPLPELPVQYADFAAWQRERTRGELLEKQLAYWKSRLAGAPPLLELPLDYPRPATVTRRGATYVFDVPGDLTEALKAFSQREGVTLYTTLVAAFLTLLHRHSGQDDLVMGTAIAERQLPEVQSLLGIFLNTLVLRVDFSDDPTVRTLLKRVRDVALDAYTNQDVPFELLVQSLQVDRSSGQNPLFQVSLMLDPPAPALAGGWTLTRMAAGTGASKFDLSLELDELPTGLAGHLEYSTDLFDEATIVRMAEHWQILLAGMVAEPAQSVAELPLLTAQESQQLLVEWNQVQRPYPQEFCLHQLFTEQAERTPLAVAAVFGNHSFTYGELNARANQFAHYLQTLGVGADTLVAICVERSLDMLVGLLGTLKAGGAYVPLDPTYPAERLAFMLEDAGVTVLVTQQHLLAQLPAHDARVVCLDTDRERFSLLSQDNPTAQVTPENLCYVIYTSGSTGRPKGVQIPHRAVVNFLHSMRQEPGLTAEDRLVAVTTLSFDIAGLELYLPLLVGARLFIASREEATSGSALAALLERVDATIMQATPITWRILLANNWQGKTNLKALCGGEALPMELVRELLPRVGSLYNMYGPTETTIWSTLQKIEPEDSTISIGRPIANTSLAILDKHYQPVPVGVMGELYIGGDGLARGYLKRPELTEERFLWLTLSDQKRERLYRTGDLARYRKNGTIELVGRVDHQIKLRGFRIELGEIEEVLARHSAVQQVVALVREDVPGDQRLVAYVLPRDREDISASVLRQHAQEYLPAYMVPSALVILEQFPQTPNGKVDRRALPAPEQEQASADGTFAAPGTELEGVIASVWARVLNVGQVGIHENFFALGGHSLLALQATSQLRQAVDVELSLRQFFDAPTVARQAELITQFQTASSTPSLPPLLPLPRPTDADVWLFPASPSQQGLWFLQQFAPQDSAYNIFATLRLHRQLNLATLEASWQLLVNRHEALRTTFALRDGEPLQQITPAQHFAGLVENLRALPEAERETAALQRATQLFQQPFDLTQGPLARLTLFQLADEEQVLLLVMHHSISDGWSLGLLLRELASLYETLASTESPTLDPLPVQFADVVAWHSSWMQGSVLDEHLAYWKQTLAGAPTTLPLLTDHPRVSATAEQGAQHTFHLSPQLTAALKELGSREQVTLYMLVVAAFQVVLERYTGQQDFLLGTTTAGRSRREVEPLVGYFVNTQVLRADLSGDPTGRVLLQRVRESVLNAQAHQDLPFDLLVKELQPERETGSTPLFQVFITQDPPLPTLSGGWDTTQWDLNINAAKFDLALDFSERAGGIVGHLEYRSALFEPETIARLARHLERVLSGLVAAPEQAISTLSLLGTEERTLLLEQWSQTQNSKLAECSIPQVFAQQVARTPQQVALSAPEGSLTYQQLNERANQVAHALRQRGVQPGDRVGICLERSLDLVVGLLGILKSGAAYVPLDPGYPIERLAFMQEDAQLAALLTHEVHLTLFSSAAVPTLCLDRDRAKLDEQSCENPPEVAGGTACAYLIYTSGSTGRPKGVLGTHRASLNRFRWMWQTYPFAAEEVCCQKTTLGFVDAVWEIFGPLLQGIRLHLVPDLVAKDPQHLVPMLAHERVSRLVLVPSLLRALLDSTPDLGARLPDLRLWVCSGEALPLELARRFQEQVPQATLLNLYGSSEVAADATCHEVGDTTGLTRVPIGRPITNTRVYVLDQAMQPVPIGLAGELYVGGEGLAQGYFQRPELTQARFVPDPFSEGAGARLYKTGDQARFRADGTLEYLGRLDQQVKVRGVRIELGEIEAVLGEQAEVEAAVVTLREDTPGDQRLVAYLVPRVEHEIHLEEVRRRAVEMLPTALLPAHWVVLPQLPLLPNGKVNRLALPAPQERQEQAMDGYVAPETALQYQLVGIWEELLKVRPVGIHENFFALGGHSLLALQATSQLRQAVDVELSLRQFFDAPTIARQAELITQMSTDNSAPSMPPLLPQPRPTDTDVWLFPASPSQQGLWFLQQFAPQDSAYNIFATLRLHKSLNPAMLEECWHLLVSRHEALRTTFVLRDGQPMQRIVPHQPLALLVEDLRARPAAEREELALQRATQLFQQPFDLARGPLARLTLFQLADEEQVLLLVMHHSISDGWSLGLLLRELASLYETLASTEPPTLDPLPVQFADVVAWQSSWMQGSVLDEHLAYWKQTLADAPTTLPLLLDHPRVSATAAQGAQHTFHLSPQLTAALKELGTREQVTLYMLVVAAFQVVLERYTGQQDFLLGTTTAGRSRREVEPLVGYFVNTQVLRADLSGDPTGRVLLQRVRESVLNAQAHQDLPFDLLVKELQPERETGSTPLFQVFITQDPPLPTLSGGWDTTQWDLNITAAKFDLALDFSERAGGIVGHLEYRSALFEPETIARLARYLECALSGFVANPEQAISTLSLLTAEERVLLEQWSQTQNSKLDERSIPQVFAQQVARTPQQVALSAPEGSLTYQQLNERANQVAHTLRQRGVQPGDRVGVCLERSLDLVVGLLGILKSGAAYVPLDPGYPIERLAFMQEDAQLAALLTHEVHLALFSSAAVPTLCLDRDRAKLDEQSCENPPEVAGGTTCAYLIYTSGSTGRPKGVLGTHRASLNRFRWMWQTYPFAAEEVCCQKTTLGFVDAVWEIFGPLLQGIRLHLVPDLVAKDPQQLVPMLAHERVSRLVLVPSLLRALLDSYPDLGARLPDLRLWVCSGEALPLELARRFQEQVPQATLLNLYGSSEVAADATCYEVGDTTGLTRVPIGRPITNTRVYVLDQAMQPVPIGLAGELYVGGEGLAQGYFQRPELTQARFVPDPFSEVAGARLYKTGDQARFRADGTLEYLGRLDQQVKVRGVRIELGEIEAVLGEQAEVEAAVVTLREDTPGDQRLVAYLVPRVEHEIHLEEVRRRAVEMLPTALLPAHWVVLPQLPLLPNGKVNRLALPAPQERQEQAMDGYVAPETALQYQLVGIWEELLKVRPVGIHENFFALGGHSLLAVRLMSRIAEVFGRDLPLSTLFQHATVARLAQVLQGEEQQQTRTPLIPIHVSGTKQPFFYLHGDPNGKAFYSLKLSQELGLDRPFYLLEPYKYDNLRHIPTLKEVAAAHIEAMRRAQPEGPYVLGGWCNGAMVAYEMAQQLRAAHQEISLLVLMDPGTSSTFSVFLHHFTHRKRHISLKEQEQQDTLFFRLLHMYEYIRLWNYRKRLKANASLQLSPEEVEIAHPNFASIFPPSEKLRDNYMAIFNLLASGYEVQPYNGKIAVFWAEEDNSGRRKTWEGLLKKEKEVTTHFIPGTHITSRIRYAHILGQKLAECIEKYE